MEIAHKIILQFYVFNLAYVVKIPYNQIID